MRVLVTGADGFVGAALCRSLLAHGYEVRAAVREVKGTPRADVVAVGGTDGRTFWTPALQDVSVVVHLVGVAHRSPTSTLDVFQRVNVDGSVNLARQAAAAGVRRLVYLSSVKAQGEQTGHTRFTEAHEPRPEDAYGASKLAAERGLLGVAQDTGLEIVIIRPPLVYGPGVKGNVLKLLKWIDRRLPVLVSSRGNRRSLVGLGNLISLIMSCIDHPRAAGEVFLVSDNEDLSTEDLVRRFAARLGRRPCLIPVSLGLAVWLARLLKQEGQIRRLFGSLMVDSAKARNLLGWKPVVSVDEEIERTAVWFRSVQNKATGR